MEDFTLQRLQNLENRSKKLGISNMALSPLTESNVRATPSRQSPSKSNVASPKRTKSIEKRQTTLSPSPSSGRLALDRINELNVDAKENSDLALEINITTGPNVQVQVQVEEQEIDGDGNVLNTIQSKRKQITATAATSSSSSAAAAITERNELNNATPSSFIRDSSKNQLDRLGALYSNPQELSSPVHRTEQAFTTDQERERRIGNQSRTGLEKLSKLTRFYNECEDDLKLNSRARANDKPDSKASPKPAAKIVTNQQRNSPLKSSLNNKTALNRFGAKEAAATNDNKNSPNKQMNWDKSMMDSLESQGFKRRDTTNKRLEYDFKDNKTDKTAKKVESPKKVVISKPPVIPSTSNSMAKSETTNAANKMADVTKGLVSGRAKIFEANQPARNGNSATSSKQQKDPTELPLRERMALFEKNKGTALIPKAALGMAPSMKQIQADQKQSENTRTVITTPQQPIIGSAPSNVSNANSKINNYNKPIKAETAASGSGIRQAVAALLSNPATIAENRIANETRKLRQQEMNVVLNRFNQKNAQEENESASPPPAPPMPKDLFKTNTSGRKCKRISDEKLEVSQQVKESLEDVKRVRINPPQSGRLYPTLPDLESTESERDNDMYTDDDNNEQPMLDRYLNRSQTTTEDGDDSYMDSEDIESSYTFEQHERRVHYADDSITSVDSNGSEMDDYLDEALENTEDDDEHTGNHKKGTITSNSFSYERKPSNRQPETIYENEATSNYQSTSKFQSPIKSRLTVNPSDDNNSVTLTHTVSFYRRQQNLNASPAVRRVVHTDAQYDSTTNDENSENENEKIERFDRSQERQVQEKIQSLLDHVGIQQQQIAQASNALNTCASTVEFSGSTESVIAEWKLLVATHSRQAALNEISRLKVEHYIRHPDAPKECGRLTVKEITVPLRQDYISKLSSDQISGHHLVCLLKYNEHVLATKTMPTLPGLLSVKFPDVLKLDNVYADFKVTLEIYGMTAQREFLPHEIKYHIKNNKKGVLKTPKGKKAESRLIMPPVQSPAGPNAIRSPSFVSYGFAIFSLREAQRNTWTLNQVSSVSPLIGTVHMKVNCALSVNIDHRGFLTMFEDVSGFGAWHRRWCRLHGNVLSYWKYPDDERKPPIGSLDLSSCEQQKITTAPRETCARLNTLMIELKRQRFDDDIDSLLLETKGDYTIVRHLLSADTKEERNEWCAHFNKALALMRAWGNSQR